MVGTYCHSSWCRISLECLFPFQFFVSICQFLKIDVSKLGCAIDIYHCVLVISTGRQFSSHLFNESWRWRDKLVEWYHFSWFMISYCFIIIIFFVSPWFLCCLSICTCNTHWWRNLQQLPWYHSLLSCKLSQLLKWDMTELVMISSPQQQWPIGLLTAIRFIILLARFDMALLICFVASIGAIEGEWLLHLFYHQNLWNGSTSLLDFFIHDKRGLCQYCVFIVWASIQVMFSAIVCHEVHEPWC